MNVHKNHISEPLHLSGVHNADMFVQHMYRNNTQIYATSTFKLVVDNFQLAVAALWMVPKSLSLCIRSCRLRMSSSNTNCRPHININTVNTRMNEASTIAARAIVVHKIDPLIVISISTAGRSGLRKRINGPRIASALRTSRVVRSSV